jgi:hypothetical protein
MPGPFPEGLIEATTEAIGESDGQLGGQLFTFLRAPLAPSDTTLLVDSTDKWPEQGNLRVGREIMRFENLTAFDEFTVTDRDPTAGITYPRGTIVYDESRIYSEIDSLRSQLVFPTATGEDLKALLRNFGLPVPLLGQDQLRAWGQKAAYPVAGPLSTIADILEAIRPGQLRFGSSTAPDVITLDGAEGGWPTPYETRLVRILEPSVNAGLYRVKSISGLAATLIPAAGPYWDAGNAIVTEGATPFELIRWDLWEDPGENNRFRIDLITFDAFSLIKGATFLQAGEEGVSTDATHVDTIHPINNVLGVFLRGDVERTGTNFFTGGSFLGQTITLGSALPGATTDVLIDYGSAEFTAQLLAGPNVNGELFFPFFLSDPSAAVAQSVEVVRAAGMIPVFSSIALT